MKQSFSQPSTQLASSPQQKQKQQWALINEYKALEFERMKQKQIKLKQEKMEKFKLQLESQMNTKSDSKTREKQQDRKYYEYVLGQSVTHRQKEERVRESKLLKRRQCEEENAKLLEFTRNSRMSNSLNEDKINFEIGTKSQIQHRQKSEYLKKAVIDTLDEQLRIKQLQKQRSLQQQRQKFLENLQYQQMHEHNRYSNKKQFGQNQQVYQYYSELERQRRMRDAEMERKLVEEAAQKKRWQADTRVRNQQYKKEMAKDELKQVLQKQVNYHAAKRIEQQTQNPQDYSYKIIGNIFRERKPTYDKQTYMQQLMAQAETKRLKKHQEQYMTDQQYRLNMNQLNKAINGEYTFGSYVDRSVGNIGNRGRDDVGMREIVVGDQSAEMVKIKMENLRNRARSQTNDRLDRSAFF